jgi:putative spermidine/putrescine transport system ATP-binding protein
MRLRVSVCGRDDFVIKVPNADGTLTLREGTQILIGWKREDCRALAAGTG